MRSMTVGSLFSGIGGFDLGLERAGHRVLWQVEADKRARSVLRKHWPDVDLYEDVCDVGKASLAPVDLTCGGFPCQDLSVAGKRAGLDGARSGLWFEFYRIVSELTPTWVLIENVPGLRSSDGGRDLAVILSGLAGLGYVGAWRSLDTQYFGPPQRRERVFILARRYPGAGCPAEVLAIAEGMSGHPAPSREEGARVAGALANGSGKKGGPDDNAAQAHHVVAAARSLAIRASRWVRYSPTTLAHASNTHGGHHQPKVPAYRKTQKARDPEDGERWEEEDLIPRRLTPRECERLQGAPDDWTRWAADGSELKDSPRYRMLGNAVTRNVAEWIGRRLAA